MKRLGWIALLCVAFGLSTSCRSEAPKEEPDAGGAVETPKVVESPLELARKNVGAFQALPKDYAREGQTAAQEELGRMLYYDTRLSKNHDLSCNSCHDLARAGVDGKPTSPGHKGQLGGRNSPTVYNAAGHFAQFWDGRAADVEAQAKGPVLNPIEMAMPDEASVVKVLQSIPGYVEAFKKAYPDQAEPVTYDNMGAAIGAFERRLVTPSRWDRFLGGDDKALSDKELDGFNLFVSTGCAGCHNGALVGGGSLQKVGAARPWPNQADTGRMTVTSKEEDRMMFKAPSLRNIAQTGPWFHDGATSKLEEAVKMMASHQLARDLTDEEVGKIVAWLEALTGEVPTDYIQKPELPPSGPETPAPDPS